MRKLVFPVLAVLFLGLVTALWLGRRDPASQPRSRPSPPPPRAPAPPPSLPSAETSPEPKPDLPEAALQAAVGDPEAFRAAASALRSRALKEAGVRERLIALLLDGKEPSELREASAFILGSLEAPEARQALWKALEAGFSPALILALGEAGEPRDLEDFFGELGSPWVRTTASGLGVRVRAELGSEECERLAPALGHADAEVRRAAILALRHSLSEASARGPLEQAFPAETDGEVQGEMGDALAQWALAKDPQGGLADRLAASALEPGRAILRFRTEGELKQLPLAAGTLERLWGAAASGEEESRRWALGLLEAHAEPERLRTLGESLAFDPLCPDKLREDAARVLGRFPSAEADLRRLLTLDPAWHVRLVAARSLGGLGTEPAREALRRAAASDPDERVRAAAARMLE